MNTKRFKLYAALLGLILAFAACQPEEFNMGKILSKEDLKYSITQNADDPNMIILESLTPGMTPLWVTPMGRSTRVKDTVKIAFEGTYKFVYGVQSAGGFVQADTVTIVLEQNNLSYVNDPLWINLTGGVGNEKTWVADNGNYGLAPGAMSYADPSGTVEFNDFTPNWEPQGNANASSDADMGWGSTMTFSLKGGAFMTTNKLNEGGKQENGTFFLNVDNHTLSTTDATILRADNYIANADNWTKDIKVLTLTDNQLRIAIMRTNSEGAWWYIWNYVSKDYADNYVPEDQPDPNFDFGVDQGDLLAVTNTKTWSLSSDTPFDWANLSGGLLNGWQSINDYPDWAGYNSTYASSVAACQISFTSDGTVKTIDNDGVEAEGTWELDAATNTVTFTDITPSFKMGSWAVATTTAENQWKIVKVAKTFNTVTDIWFGQRSTDKDEYFVFHFVLGTGSVAPDPEAVMRKLLSDGSTQSWSMDTIVPFSWGRNDTHDLDYTDAVPDWAGYTDPSTVAQVRLAFSNDGSVTYTGNDGTVQAGTFTLDMDKNTITFSSEISISFEICSGWVRCELTEGNYWELYKTAYDNSGKLSEIWFGKQTDLTSGPSGERMVYHFYKTVE